MKVRFTRNFWIYTVTLVVCIVLMFLAKWLFQYVGSDNQWLPIIADGGIAAFTFIAGNWISNADRLRTKLNDKKADFEIIRSSVERMTIALNIKRRQQYFIFSLDPTMSSRELLHEILSTQQEIEDARVQLKSIQYLVESKEQYDLFKDACDILIKQFQIVLDGLVIVANKWCDTTSHIEQVKTIIELNGEQDKKNEFASLYKDSCKFLQSQKTHFIDTYNSQKDNLEHLIDKMRKYADTLLKAEQSVISEINRKIR